MSFFPIVSEFGEAIVCWDANGLDPLNLPKNLIYDGTTGLDRTRRHYNSPDVALHSAGFSALTTGTTGLIAFFQ